MTASLALVLALTLVTGCANGAMYWTRGDATPDMFRADHWPCFDTAYIGYGVGSEAAYKACMASKGWTRTQGTGSQYPSGVFFRGPEGDDDFTPAARAGSGWLEYWSRQQ